MTLVSKAVLIALSMALHFSAHAVEPKAGEYVCTKMKGTLFPCTPVHLFLQDGDKWSWGSKYKGSYHMSGSDIKFEGPNHGPVAWGPSRLEGNSIVFQDQKISAIFTLKSATK